MEKSIKIFDNPSFGKIRTVAINGEPYFVGKDVAKALGYSNPRDALKKRVDKEDKADGVAVCDSIGREQTPTLINESGLYSLILSSKLPKAKEFKHWVTAEVLPSIRKTGSYGMDNLQEIISRTVAETVKQILPVIQKSTGSSDCEEEEIVIRRAKRRKPIGIIAKLPFDLRSEVDDMICSERFTYEDIQKMLAEEGISVSLAAVSRYRQRYFLGE
ncbi:MAG: DUF3486 family protein [Ruminococcus sp.]|nr:DUF3486 family protein [Ruminococcus sp.]